MGRVEAAPGSALPEPPAGAARRAGDPIGCSARMRGSAIRAARRGGEPSRGERSLTQNDPVYTLSADTAPSVLERVKNTAHLRRAAQELQEEAFGRETRVAPLLVAVIMTAAL